jgi:hypothetical protein
MNYPRYTLPGGAPNPDPYGLSKAEEAEIAAEAQQQRENRRAELIDDIAQTLADANDLNVSWQDYARAVVELLELRKIVDWDREP